MKQIKGFLAFLICLALIGCGFTNKETFMYTEEPFSELDLPEDAPIPKSSTSYWSELSIDLNRFSDLGHLEYIGFNDNSMEQFFESQLSTGETKIALVDSGFDLNHHELEGRVSLESQALTGQAADFDYEQHKIRGSFHGTHTSCIAAAGGRGESVGVHPRAELILVNYIGGGSTIYDIVENGLKSAADKGAQVINLSMGCANILDLTEGPNPCRNELSTAREQQFVDTLKEITSRGIVIIMAAGNSGKEIDETRFLPFPIYLAKDIDGVISVTGVESSTGTLPDNPRTGNKFFNYGQSFVELASPGVDSIKSQKGIKSCWSDTSEYTRNLGTSMAAPIVSGAAALVLRYLEQNSIKIPLGDRAAFVEEVLTDGSRVNESLSLLVDNKKELHLPSILEYLSRY